MEQAVKSSQISASIDETEKSRFLTWINEPFPFYLNDDKKNFALVFAISSFVTLFLFLFKTQMEIIHANGLEWVHGLITFGVLLFNVLILPKILPVWMDSVSWTVKKYALLNILHLVLICIVATILEKLFFCPYDMGWSAVASHTIGQVAIKGVIPIMLTTMFLRARMLQENLREAIKTNQELQKIQTLKKDSPKSSNKITLYSDTSESLSFNMPDLLFIEADDNYSTVMWKESGEIQKKLLRVNLKNLESQLDNSFTLRCHRSYIVNVNAISAITGNTNGYKLKINDSDFSIPVSRPKGKEVMEKISQLRNMMELS